MTARTYKCAVLAALMLAALLATAPSALALSPVPGSPFSGGGSAAVAYSPSGNFLATANSYSGTVSMQSVNASTGALTQVSGSPFPDGAGGGGFPVALAFNPSGTLLAVANNSANSVSVYSVNASTGALTPVAGSPFPTFSNDPSADSSAPVSLAFNPTGSILAVANHGNETQATIDMFAVNASTGALTPATSTDEDQPTALAFSSNGLLAVTTSYNALDLFTVDATTGAVTRVGSSGGVGNPVDVTFNPSGDLIAVTNQIGGTELNLSMFQVNASGSTVTFVNTFATSAQAESVAFSPSGDLLAVSDESEADLWVYSVDQSSGNVTPVTGSPLTTPAGTRGVAFSPDGRWLSATSGTGVSVFTTALAPSLSVSTPLGSTTLPTIFTGSVPDAQFSCQAATGDTLASGTAGCSASVDGGSAIASGTPLPGTLGEHTVVLTATETNGQSTSETGAYMVPPPRQTLQPVAVPGSPVAAGSYPNGVAFAPSGDLLAVPNGGDNTVSVYSVNQASGALVGVTGSPFATGDGPVIDAFSPSGNLLAITNELGNSVSIYAVNGSTGALTQVAGSPFATGNTPFGVAFSPSGGLLAVANKGDGTVSVYTVNSSTGALAPVSGSPFSTGGAASGPMGVAFSPSGNLLAVTDHAYGAVATFTIDDSTDTVTPAPGSPLQNGDSQPVGLAFSPDGQYLVVADEGSQNINIARVQANGSLSEVYAVSSGQGTGYGDLSSPYEVAFSSSGNLLAVTNLQGNDISVYSWDESLPWLTPVTGTPTATGSEPFGVAFDPSGSLIAVANDGSGNVSMFSTAAAPTVSISAPSDGAAYGVASVPSAAFTCTAGSGGTLKAGLAGCSASIDGGSALASGAPLASAVGSHTIVVTANQGDGQSASTSYSYSVGKPSVTLTAPAASSTYSFGSVPDAAFTCIAPTGTTLQSGLAGCSAQVDGGAPIASGSPLPGTDGSHTIVVTANDSAGDTASVSRTYLVQGGTPTVTITAPVNEAQYMPGSVPDANFSCTAGANGTLESGLAGCSAVITGSDGTAFASGTALPQSAGGYTITVTANDTDGQSSDAIIGYFVEDTTPPPTITINTPPNGAAYVLGSVPAADFTCKAIQPHALQECVASFDGGPRTNYDGAQLPDTLGQHTIQVTAQDDRGLSGESQQSSTYTVVASASPPSAAITTPTNGQAFTYGSVPNAAFSCAPGAASTLATGLTGCSGSIDGGSAVASGAPLAGSVGSHTIVVTATDADDQSTEVSHSYTVVAQAPSAQISTPTDGATFTVGSVPNADFSCTAGAGGTLASGLTGCSASIDGGAAVATGTPLPSSVGSHTIVVTATDSDGQSSMPVSHSYTVTAPSSPPTATITTPAAGAAYTYGSVPSAAFGCTAGAGGTLNSGLTGCSASIDGGAPVATGSPLPGSVGSHTIAVTATDADGQSSTPVSHGYTVSKAPTRLIAAPQLVLVPPPHRASLSTVSATLTSGGQPVSGRTIAFSAGSTALCTAVTGATGTASCTVGLAGELHVLLTGGYTASFAGDGDYLPSTASTPAIELGTLTALAHLASDATTSRDGIEITRGTLTRRGVNYGTVTGGTRDGVVVLRLHPEPGLAAGQYTITVSVTGHGVHRRIRKEMVLR